MTYSFVAKTTSGKDVTINVSTEELRCPRCGSREVEDNTLPIDQWVWNIRAFRIDDWSKCLVCKRKGYAKHWFNRAGEFGT